MQDPMYDRLRDVLGANAEEGIDERFKKLVGNPTEPDFEELMEREHLREKLEPKYVIVKNGPLYEFRARYVDMRRMTFELKAIEYREGREEWGAEKGKKYLVEVLGRRTTLDGTKLLED